MKKILLSILLIFLGILMGSSVTAADWLKTYQVTGYDTTYFDIIQQNSDGDYIAAGYVGNGFSKEALIAKLDSSGNHIWANVYEDTAVRISHIQQTSDNGYIVAGGTEGTASKFNFLKIDASGNHVWAKDYGIYSITSIQQNSDGDYIAAGCTEHYTSADNRNLVVKLDSSGNKIWAKTYGGVTSMAYTVIQTSDGGYIVGGDTYDYAVGDQDMLIVKLDSAGNEIWAKSIGSGCKDNVSSIQQTSDGGYIIGGGGACPGALAYGMLVVKIDAAGNQEWARASGGIGYIVDRLTYVQQTSDNGYIVAGVMAHDSATNPYDVFIVKLDSSGNEVWQKVYNGIKHDRPGSVQQTSDGGYIVGGALFKVLSGDGFFIKLNSTGGITGGCPNIQNSFQGVLNKALTVSSHSLSYSSPSFTPSSITPAITSVTVVPTDVCFGLPSAPAVSTNIANSITLTSAQLNGSLTDLGGDASADVWFEWGLTAAYGNTTASITKNIPDTFFNILGSLSSGTTYHFRAVAQNSIGTSYGIDRSFTTLAPITPPTVLTNLESSVADTSAQLNGNLTNLGGDASADVWFEWGITAAYGNTTAAITKTGVAIFSNILGSLSSGTTYHFRAVAQNTVGTSYGNNRSFTTAAPAVVPPTVITTSEQSVDSTSAQLNGSLTDLGGDASADVWFEWEETAVEPVGSYANTLSSPGSPKSISDVFFANLSGLTPGTDYYFRAVAQNTAGTSYGDGEHFATAIIPPPTATGLSCTGDSKEMYCLEYATTTGAVVSGRGGAVDFTWEYDHPEGTSMKNFFFQAATSPFPTANIVVSTTSIYSAIDGATINYSIEGDYLCSEADCGTLGSDKLTYGQNYYWQVKVCDINDVCSNWTGALMQAQIPNHRAPEPNFSWTVLQPAADKIAQFCSVKEGDCSTMLDIDKSVCYNQGNQPISCSAATIKWTIPATAQFATSSAATDANPKIKFTELGVNEITLEITGSGPCAKCKSMEVSSLPTWIEDDPFK